MEMEQVISRFNIDYWKPITLYHIDEVPRHFKTRKELRKFCNEKGCESAALL
jgi:hypothetical protein